MRLLINGITGKYTIPNVNKIKYRYEAFDPKLNLRVDGEPVTIVVQKKVDAAWSFVTKRAAVHKPCNEYFKTLSKKTPKTLQQVLDEGDITLHMLAPKKEKGYTYLDVPAANSAGRDIGIHPEGLLQEDERVLGCTLIHELAHVAGATGNSAAPDAGAAESSLLRCLCTKYYDPRNIGLILVEKSASRVV